MSRVCSCFLFLGLDFSSLFPVSCSSLDRSLVFTHGLHGTASRTHFTSHDSSDLSSPIEVPASPLSCCSYCAFGNEEESVLVKEGDSVTLDSDLTEIKDDDVIQWRFGNTLIAEINKLVNRITVYDDVLDGRFRDRLKLDNQTGSLTITFITMKHAGVYELQINSVRKKKANIIIYELTSAMEGYYTTLKFDLTEIKDVDVIQWRFGNTLIAEINKQVDRIIVYDDVLDGRFRDRLKLDKQTGSLTITDITDEQTGDYTLEINSVRKKKFSVRISGSVKSVLVNEGDSVTLNSDLTEMKDDDEIQWRLRDDNDKWWSKILIAEINKLVNRFTVYDDVLDGRFRDRLKLDNQTGSLTITDTTTEHVGLYERKINYMNTEFFLAVFVEISVWKGDSVTLNSDLTEMKRYDWIRWRFGNENTLIAEINKRVDRFTVYDDVLDGRFRDRLKLDNQTGSLTITNITTEHAEDYKLVMRVSHRYSLKAFSVDITDEQTGDYTLEINSVRKKKFSVRISGSVKSVLVNEGDSVTLNSDLTEMKDDDEIQWRLRDDNDKWWSKILIAEINKLVNRITVYDDVLDGRFRDRLKLDNQTGSLTITDTTTEHVGLYERKINYMNTEFFLAVFDEISVWKGDSVTLNSDLTEMKRYDWIRWRFGNENTLIAEINKRVDRFTVYDDVLDGRFRDRLKLDNQTGSLTITNITTEHAEDYKLVMRVSHRYSLKAFSVAHLSVPVISSDCSSSSSSSSCSLVCSAVNVSHVTLSWYKGNRLLSRISASNRRISLSLPLEVEYQDKNTYSCVISNPISNQTQHLNITQLCHTCSDSVHCCGPTEAVIRLVLSALVGVATVILLVYDIRSRRAERDQTHIHTSET
ncbi:SLAM family member 5 [Anabarilius grahami]|uniref:SLAM family member 5 n=1 Tax=Anabarilius grahami TaxID=495550 RepID=A0A3N0YSC0_ANAGA|nr:SLAM family member 5 [Anabarilius grahami]